MKRLCVVEPSEERKRFSLATYTCV